MNILLISDHPESEELTEVRGSITEIVPFTVTPFDPEYCDEFTDPPEDVKLLKHRLHEADSVIVHILPKQTLSNLIAWGRLKSSDWSQVQSATVIREDRDRECEAQMSGRLADVLDEDMVHSDDLAEQPTDISGVIKGIQNALASAQ